MDKKGALDLSVSTIIIIIICSVTLVASFVFLMQLVKSPENTNPPKSINLFEEKNEVYVPPSSASSPRPSSKDDPILLIKQTPEVSVDCLKDLKCDFYFIFVPLGNWDSQAKFETKVKDRSNFFIDISKFKFKKVGIISVPLEFVASCDLPQKIDQKNAAHHQKVKFCTDTYADKLGIDYERVIGLLGSYEGGRAFFGAKTVMPSLGFSVGDNEFDRPGIVAHEIGHSYDLCDEYSLAMHKQQQRFTASKKCENAFPQQCDASVQDCDGNTPTFRDYTGAPLLNVCGGSVHYSVMGFSRGNECGLDRTGGYEEYCDID
ncbi:MAG TPA: hypothetical protein VJB66_01290, partial [Candidatus Nanoarchaeia archaeon]|nr:hypothetical protein [Candidatus Nanoarchaeia archaeon]